MYPFLRMAWHMTRARRAADLGPFGTHVSNHMIWPQDLDPWVELNNGRTLTLYDLGRLPLFLRNGMARVMKREGWRGTVAGCSVRYRRRIRLWDRVEMRSRIVGFDDRFFYLSQSLWNGDDCAGQVLVRSAVIDAGGIVPTERVVCANGIEAPPPLPGWVTAWTEAEGRRPWPPEDPAD